MATVNDPTLKQSGNALQGRSDATQRGRPRGLTAHNLVRSSTRFDAPNRMANPLDTLWHLSREIDRLVGSAVGGMFGTQFGSGYRTEFSERTNAGQWAQGTWAPQIDVEQRQDALVVSADLPGVDKDDVHIEASEEALTIWGETHEETEVNEARHGFRACERYHGSFSRTIPLPQQVKLDELRANMRNGVLTVTVPLDEHSRPRRVDIGS